MVSINGIGRIFKSVGKLAFMDEAFSKSVEETLKNSANVTNWRSIHKQNWKNIHKQIGDAFVQAERRTASEPFWTNLWKEQILGFPKSIKTAWARKGFLAKAKGIGGAIGKRLPLIFAAFELPNIFSAFKDNGIVGGCTEILKSGTKLAGGMAGFLVGQALIPIPLVGGLIGAFGAGWLIDKIVGKSHTEKKEEAEALAQQQQEATNFLAQQPQQSLTPQVVPPINIPTVNPQQLMMMKQALYGGGMTNPMDQDFMAMSSGINNLGQKLNYLS